MTRVGEFEKVSYEQFYTSMKFDFNYTDDQIKVMYEKIELPRRSTALSAGYDIHSPIAFDLEPQCSVKIPTGIRVKIEEGWWLGCFPRSGLGFKYRCQLDNTLGVIDGDYYYSDNEGHIFLKITNDNYQKKTLKIGIGDRIAQGIFIGYGITFSDDAKGVRNGGLGSTDSI